MKLVEFLQEIRDTFGIAEGEVELSDLTLRATTDPDMDYNAIAIIIEGNGTSLFLSFPGHKMRR